MFFFLLHPNPSPLKKHAGVLQSFPLLLPLKLQLAWQQPPSFPSHRRRSNWKTLHRCRTALALLVSLETICSNLLLGANFRSLRLRRHVFFLFGFCPQMSLHPLSKVCQPRKSESYYCPGRGGGIAIVVAAGNFQAFWNSEHGHFRGQSNYGNVVTASALPSSQVDKVSLMEPVSSLLYSKRCWASSSRVRCAVVEAVVAAVCTSLLARNGMTSFWQYCQELLLLYTIPKKWLYYGWPK